MDLFVYGTLRHLEFMQAVAGERVSSGVAAELLGYEVTQLSNEVVPFISEAENKSAIGCIYRGLTEAQAARLDLFERAFSYEREIRPVKTEAGLEEVSVYLPPPSAKGGSTPWLLEAWVKNHFEPTKLAVTELFSHDPLPSPEELRRMWPVMEKRAWAKHRAASDGAAPASLRHDASSSDMQTLNEHPPLGSFFRIQSFEVTHRTFDGGQSDVLPREVFMGVDAALVLPYDPKTGKVLLVEQARMGPHRRGDPNPWQLEPVAGMTDARETPEEAAHREMLEEAGIKTDHLDKMFAIYPSPGCSTDYFVCFSAICDLSGKDSYLGGLEDEAEDLRMHVVDLDLALNLIDTGEISAGPLVAMLYWLERNKDRYAGLA